MTVLCTVNGEGRNVYGAIQCACRNAKLFFLENITFSDYARSLKYISSCQSLLLVFASSLFSSNLSTQISLCKNLFVHMYHRYCSAKKIFRYTKLIFYCCEYFFFFLFLPFCTHRLPSRCLHQRHVLPFCLLYSSSFF